MAMATSKTNFLNVYCRWRPLVDSEVATGEIDRTTISDTSSLSSVSINRQSSPTDRLWKSAKAFKAIFEPDDDNAKVYNAIVAPAVVSVLQGGTCSFFAYGHSGSGKTHTIIGYDYENDNSLGLCLGAARDLFQGIEPFNQKHPQERLGIGFSLFELRKKSAFDLLNKRVECHIREGPDGKTHIRGPTETIEGGKVRVCPIVQHACWTFESFRQDLIKALGQRAVGSSSVHDQSSRTHAVLELEIINQALVNGRQALYDRQSELVPVGKRATDISIEEQSKAAIRTPEGGWIPNPDYQVDQARIDAVEAEKAEFEARVTAAEEAINNILQAGGALGLGGKMVFVDLAGAEYHQEKGSQVNILKQTPQEKQEGRQINSDLLALKEVMRAWSKNLPRIPFRSSSLTMVLRQHFLDAEKGNSNMIVTVSPAKDQYAATLNSLKYGSLVGASNA
ncbi:hypothetical protein jhhlp_005320 [Lomentospora prolificans]|uniref:Kinesin-like protein n=1 Tax=Lomentospora prolificans TaxID=41688 RepID=A0A2N3N7G3_9PEZI|nr:hypothetical protein jhhlp_005320 [Lomentospora prolificans]